MNIWRSGRSLRIMLLRASLLLVSSFSIFGQSQTTQDRQFVSANAPVEVEVIGDKRVRYEVELTPG
jgi:hypothetical protein